VDSVQITGPRAHARGSHRGRDRRRQRRGAHAGGARSRAPALKEVPAIRATALEYVPVSGGRAEVRATVTERRLFRSAWPTWARSRSGRFSCRTQRPRSAR
jgi:hypothetical protein